MISKTARQNLLKIATAYAKATKTALPTVSRKFYGRSTFIEDFRRGKCCITFVQLAKMLQKFSNEWPEGTPWPEPVPIVMSRPKPRK